MPYWHRTCEHAAPRIDQTLLLRPNPQPMLGDMPLIWLTSASGATRAMLGLSSHTLGCDRMHALYRVVSEDEEWVVPWGRFTTMHSMADLRPFMRRLEAVRGTVPAVWAVSAMGLRVVRED